MNRAKVIGFGLLAILAAIVLAAIPRSEGYSNFGLGLVGNVDVKCGSVFSRDQRVEFDGAYEQSVYLQERQVYGEPDIFEGKTETEVCDEALRTQKIVSILLAIGGGVALLVGLFAGSSGAPSPAAAGAGPSTSSAPPFGAPPRGASSPPTVAADAPPAAPPGGLGPPADTPVSVDVDEPTKRALSLVEVASSRVPTYIAPRLFLAASLAYLVASLGDEDYFRQWGSIGYLKGIILATIVAAAIGFKGTMRYADLVAAIGSAYVLGDGLWRLFAGFGSVWVRILVSLADAAIVVGLVQYLGRRGPPANRVGALADHARVVLIGCGVVALVVIVLGTQRNYGGLLAETAFVVVFWGLCLGVIALALLIRSHDMLVFAAAVAALRFISLFMGWNDYATGAWPVLSKIGLAAIVAFAAWQWYALRQSASGAAPELALAGQPSPAMPPSSTPRGTTDGAPRTAAPAAGVPEPIGGGVGPEGESGVDDLVVFETSQWSTDDFRVILERLRERGVVFEVQDGQLSVVLIARAVTEFIIDEVISSDSPA